MPEQRNYAAIRSQDELDELVGKLEPTTGPIGFDIETGYEGSNREAASLHPEEGIIVGFSISGDPRWARYVPLAHELTANLDTEEALGALAPLSGRFVAHNAKFERRFLRFIGFDYGFFSDTMVEAYVLSKWRRVGLKFLVKENTGYDQKEIATLFPDLKKKDLKSLRFNQLELSPEVVSYGCDDAALCLELHNIMYPQVENNFIYKLEMSLQTILCEMEEAGVDFDWEFMLAAAEQCERFMKLLEAEIMADVQALTGKPIMFNLGSPKQVGDVLFGELGMVTNYKTQKGAFSTAAVALNSLSKQYPLVKKILQYKELRTLLTRYLSKWPVVYSYASDGRTHPNIQQTAVGTGRFAVNDPPYQQTPKKYKYTLADGREFVLNFRLAIRARAGYYLVHFDYSQVELRAIAGAAQEPTLLAAFANGQDVHTATASLMLGMPVDQVQEEHRDIGKTMNFALMYQMGPGSLADRLAISRERAKELYDLYFSSYSAIATWVARAKERGKAYGYAETHFGRRYTIWELQSSDPKIYSKGERVAVNAPIQGWAADYMKIAMVRQDKAREAAGLKGDLSYLIMNNHDALTFEVREDVDLAHFIQTVHSAVTFPVPGFPNIEAEWSTGPRWGEMKKLKVLEGGELVVEDEAPTDDDPFATLEDEDGEAVSSGPSLDLSVLDNRPSPIVEAIAVRQDALEEAAGIVAAVSDEPIDGYMKVIVELERMPDTAQVQRFVDWYNQIPSREDTDLVLRTPEGDVPFNWSRDVRPEVHGSQISLIFGSAKTYLDTVSVNVASVLDGVSL